MASLRVLIAEDEPTDAELIVRALRRSGYDPEWQRVDTAEAFDRHLGDAPPDVIISDHAMPQFSAADALDRVQARGLSIPFIVVSHAVGEEEAVGLIRRGAADYLMKDRLGRLGEAVRQALDERRLQQAHAEAQAAVVRLNQELERRIDERTTELQAAKQRLEAELAIRAKAEAALQQLNLDLERLVEQRTKDVIASHHRLRALASELTLAEQRERKRLAGELHDYLAQMLALGRMKIGQLRPTLVSVPHAAEPVREIDELFKNALSYTRSLMAKLSPPVLDELGLPAALAWLAEQMPLHGLSVEVRLAQDDVTLPDDEGVLLFQSVRELLINVAKHAGTDRATVALRVDEQRRLHVSVEDRGRGFEPAAIEAKPSGEHFGLFSVRERMQAMGGWLDIRSAIGRGTTVTLVLPLAEAQAGGAGLEARGHEDERETALISHPLASGPSPLASSRIRVLLVDDHTLVRQGVKSLLESYPDVTVIGEAADGQQAVVLAAQLAPSLVLMDVNMPRMDGIEATRRLTDEWPEIPVIGLSVNDAPHVVEAMTAAGAVAVISKDTAPERLYEAVLAARTGERPLDELRRSRSS
jgi:DNA-binding NarL/FixJ family response regulator/anti-sigma regulatory factor (Ser/Thr protein kinase)